MRKIVVLSLVAALAVLTAGPAEGVSRSKPGASFVRERGECGVTTPGLHAVLACTLDDRHRIVYRFWLPHDARLVGIRVHHAFDSKFEGCCGSLRWASTRRGPHRRLLVVKVMVWNYGGSFGYEPRIHRVEVRYRHQR